MNRTIGDAELLETLATGVAVLDVHGVVTRANSAFAEHTGIGRTRIIGRTLEVLRPNGEQLHALASRARAESRVHGCHDAVVCAAPERESHLDVTLTPHADGLLVEVHPAAPRAEPTRVSESLRGFAHEVRNPLAAISGAAQLLGQRATDAGQRELAQLIRDESLRLATLTERLLGTRKATATRAINVHALLERVIELLAAERPDVVVVRDYDPTLPAWHGDPDRVLQALLNLVRNAIEAEAQRVVLRTRDEAGLRDATGRRVAALRIEVEDDGNGVPDAIAQTLFEPLVSGRANGSGLGLALAREIAREHGGELAYRPRDPGACFVLLLPRHPRTPEHGA